MQNHEININVIEFKKALYQINYGDELYWIRPIQEADLSRLLEWRNSPRVSEMMFSDHSITWSEHKRWFERIHSEKMKTHLMLFCNKDPIGYLAYNKIDWEEMSCETGAYIGDKEKASIMAGLALNEISWNYAKEVLGMKLLHVYVYAGNKRLIKMFGEPTNYIKKYFYKDEKYHDVAYYRQIIDK